MWRVLVSCIAVGVFLLVACTDNEATIGPTGEPTDAAAATEPAEASAATDEREFYTELKAIPSITFDRSEIVRPAGEPITLRFVNQDLGIEHNFSVYEDDVDSAIVATTYCRGDCVQLVTLNLNRGEYRFQCEIHPWMFGRLTAK